MRTILLISILILLSSCATTSTHKVYQNMALAGLAGASYGSTKDDYKTTQSILYGSSAALVAAVLTLYFEGPDRQEVKLREEVRRLREKLDEVTGPKVVARGEGTLGAKIPEKYRGMVQPGEWKIYEMDRWIEDGENRLVHSDKAMELIPPTLVPGRQ